MHYDCPQKFIERPELLVDALAAHEVVIKFDTSTLQGVGAIDLEPLADCDRYEAFRIALRTNRCRANLCVDDVDGLPLIASSPLIVRLSEVFLSLGIVPIPSPIEEELDFVHNEFGERAGVAKLIAQTRIKQQNVIQAVKDEAFEKAVTFRDQRDALLDQLNKSCTT